MNETFKCDHCSSPWMDRLIHPTVFSTLANLPINWCSCTTPALFPVDYEDHEYREAYFLAMSATMSGENDGLAILLSEEDLLIFQWIRRKEDAWWITTKGRKLLPLCLIVASDFNNAA